MKPIEQADFLEMRWMPFVFGLIILMTLHYRRLRRDEQRG